MLIQMAGQEAVDFETLYMKVSDYLPENANKVEAPAEEKAEEEEQADVPEVEADQADAGEETEAAKQ